MRRVGVLLVVCIGCIQLSAQGLNFKTQLFQSKFSDEQWPGAMPSHVGYTAGVDVFIPDGSTLIMPGIHFQKTSIFPEKTNFTNPYKEFLDIKSLKVPLQVGLYVMKSDLIDLVIHGGLAATYLLGVDENDKLNEDDINDLRGAFIGGVSLRLFFLTVHAGYEHGFSRIYSTGSPSKIEDKSKERIFSVGLGFYF